MATKQQQNLELVSHVPQQNRKHKLRFTTQNGQQQQQNPTPSNVTTNHTMSSQNLALSLSVSKDNYYINNNSNYATGPLGPFTGYASILKSSKFLKPAQQILSDIFGANLGLVGDFQLSECFSESEQLFVRESIGFNADHFGFKWKTSKLIVLLHEVYRRYKLYWHQMQSVIGSFEAVAGLSNAAPFMYHAIINVSKHFTSLKNALLNQINSCDNNNNNNKSSNYGTTPQQQQQHCLESYSLQNPSFDSALLQQSVWRSQRGLPEQAVAVLKAWLFEHFLHPYPTDSEKQMLAQQTGLSRSQVSNWFINARVRLWKPMVEEVHLLESQQQSRTNHQNPTTIHTKRSRNNVIAAGTTNHEHRQDQSNVGAGRSNIGVSLALGLQQSSNHCGIGFSWNSPLPMNMETIDSIGSVVSASTGSFSTQNKDP